MIACARDPRAWRTSLRRSGRRRDPCSTTSNMCAVVCVRRSAGSAISLVVMPVTSSSAGEIASTHRLGVRSVRARTSKTRSSKSWGATSGDLDPRETDGRSALGVRSAPRRGPGGPTSSGDGSGESQFVAFVAPSGGYAAAVAPAVLAARAIALGTFQERGLVPPDRQVRRFELVDFLIAHGTEVRRRVGCTGEWMSLATP